MGKVNYIIFLGCFFFPSFCKLQEVGIGTTSPTDALHVVGNDPLRIQVGTATKLRVLNNGGTSLGSNNTTGTPANGLFVQGNTGLGVNNPTDKLEILGNLNLNGEIKTNGTSGTTGQILQSNGNGSMSWSDPTVYKNFDDFFNPASNPSTWMVPAGVTDIMVEMWGAGGGGSTSYGGGGGGYVKFLATVVPGQSLTINIGNGGEGITIVSAATAGENTTCGGPTIPTVTAYGGSQGSTGLGGDVSINTTLKSIRQRGKHGAGVESTFAPYAAGDYAQIFNYGKGGDGGNTSDTGGLAGQKLQDYATSTALYTKSGRFGNAPGGGGGGAPNQSASSPGGAGADGYVIIWW